MAHSVATGVGGIYADGVQGAVVKHGNILYAMRICLEASINSHYSPPG